jgi:holin-like protein
MIAALATLLAFQLAGEALRAALHLPVPGPVIGMALLLVWLVIRRGRASPCAIHRAPCCKTSR